MEENQTSISKDKLIDIYINTLNNIQEIIKRLSNIGFTLYTISLTITSILIPLIYSLALNNVIKIIICLVLLLTISSLFISHLFNLKNERLWRLIYNDKCKISEDLFNSKNALNEILNIDFQYFKKLYKDKVKIKNQFKSWLTLCWFPLFMIVIISLIIINFI